MPKIEENSKDIILNLKMRNLKIPSSFLRTLGLERSLGSVHMKGQNPSNFLLKEALAIPKCRHSRF